ANFAADPAPGVIAWLRPRRALLVLDSCERVVDGAAVLAEQVLRSAPGVHVLATSREPLRAEGERVLRIPTLELPPPSAGQTATDALKYSAVQLFIERASALLDRFEFRDTDAPAVVKICSRLGGIALAIELAASHVTTFDLQTLADLLDDRLGLLARGRRTALPRHQTMRAVLAWSYETLQDCESLVLRRLAVFEAAFALQAACAVAGQDSLDAAAIVTSLGSLVDKSLIVAEISDSRVDYRLLDTTRAYAREKLDASGERAAVERWHARHVLAVFQQAPVEWSRQPPARWLAAYRHEAASGLAALDWAFSSDGEVGLALDLAAAVAPILFEVSLVQECRAWASRALDVLSRLDRPDPLRLLRLRATLGAALMYTDGPLPGTVQVWQTVLGEATAADDDALEGRALWALWTANIYGGEPRQALDFAQRFNSLVIRQGDIARMLMGERIVGACLHALGEHGPARERFEGMLARYSPVHHRWQTLGSQIDQGTMVRSTLSRIEWLQGYPDRAMALRAQALDGVRTAEHAISLCYVLAASSIPVAWEAGDREAAQAALKLLATTAAENGLSIWRANARCLELASWEPRDRPVTVGQLQDALHELRATGYMLPGAWLAGLLART
ncbi:MAG: transcriptional regulator, partial [Chitinophagaceae bacterium]|nr:transcriptional regulator [Rubrivivax sp.]